MLLTRIIAAAAVATTLIAAPAQAAVVELTFREQPAGGSSTQFFGPNVYFDWQENFHAGALTGDYEFRFSYDTAAASPNYGLTLLSGRIGAYTDFTDWNASLIFNPNNNLRIQLVRTLSLNCCLHYTGGVYFDLRDNDGDIGPALPQTLNLADLDTASAAFEVRRAGGVGQGYKNVGFGRIDGTVGVPQGGGGPPTGGVPEPGAWALMILGFAAAGAALRRQRALPA